MVKSIALEWTTLNPATSVTQEPIMVEKIADKKKRFEESVKLFVERLAEDSCILAAVLVGSITDETVCLQKPLQTTLRQPSDGR